MWRGVLFAIFVLGSLCSDANAQDAAPSEPRRPDPSAAGDKGAKVPLAERMRNLDFLFGALKAAPDAVAAKHIETRIFQLWAQSPSDTTQLLMTRVKTAMDAKDAELAISLLDAVVEIRPDYLEAWNRRATIHFTRKDYGRALADIQQVLAREPRHFGALAGLGMILQEIGDEKRALEAYRMALALHPHLERIPQIVEKLSPSVEGRDI